MTSDEENRLRERAQFTKLVATMPAAMIVEIPDSERVILLWKKLVDIDKESTVIIEYDAELRGFPAMVAAVEAPLRLAAEEGADGMSKRLRNSILRDAQALLSRQPGARI